MDVIIRPADNRNYRIIYNRYFGWPIENKKTIK